MLVFLKWMFNTRKCILLHILYITDKMSSDQKKKSLCCPRGLWSQCMKHNKGLASKRQNDNTKNYHKTSFFPGMKSNQKCTTKMGEWDRGNISVVGLSVSVKIKPLLWICSCSLLIQTLDSYPCMILLEHCDITLCLHLFQNITDNNYNNSHSYNHTFQTNFFTKLFEPVVALEQIQGAELHVMWAS